MKFGTYALFPILILAGIVSTLKLHAEMDKNITGLNSDIAHFKVDVGRIFGFFAKNRADVEFEFATKNVYGTDGKPTTPSEKEELVRMEDYFKKNVAEMFGFQNLNCTYKLADIDKKYNKKMRSNVGVIEVEYKVICDEDINGRDIILNLRALKDIKAIRYTVESKKISRGYILGNQGVIAVPR